MDAQNVLGFLGETDAIVAHSKTQFTRCSLQLLYVALAALGETKKRSEDAHGGLPVQGADVGPGALGPEDFFHAYSFGLIELLRVNPNSARSSSLDIPCPPCRSNQALDSATAWRSCSLSGSSSAEALAMARETGSSIASSSPTTADT